MIKPAKSRMPDEPTVIQAFWNEFAKPIMPDLGPGDPQYDAMKIAYYSGALAILELCSALGSSETVSEDQGNELLSATHEEVEDFLDNIGN